LIQQESADTSLLEVIPKRWEKFADVALFQHDSFSEKGWSSINQADLWAAVANALKVERIGRVSEIVGEKREPTVELVLGEDDWVIRRENGIDYGYNLTKCMFSAGNVNERRRMGEVAKQDEVVLDLYAGIGYYTLPILVQSQVNHVHCCEWNTNSVKALESNLKINDVSDRCSVYVGDNRITGDGLKGIADRVILGLLPSSQGGYSVAMQSLSESGGMLHIHGVAPAKDYSAWVGGILDELRSIDMHRIVNETALIRVKSYAPHWDHVVLDVSVE
tara:strand:+ start:191 stop:1018 length:828 start_codon:yes stop_codon:yes gene_type:complete